MVSHLMCICALHRDVRMRRKHIVRCAHGYATHNPNNCHKGNTSAALLLYKWVMPMYLLQATAAAFKRR